MLIAKSTGARVVKLALLMMAASTTFAAEPVSFASFDIPGATSYFVAGINDEGLVTGSWTAADGSTVGFLRSPDGRISTPILHPDDNTRTTVLRAVNDEGVIAGFYGANVSQRSVRGRHHSRGAQYTCLWNKRLWNCGRRLG
jgi:hypothetical protein